MYAFVTISAMPVLLMLHPRTWTWWGSKHHHIMSPLFSHLTGIRGSFLGSTRNLFPRWTLWGLSSKNRIPCVNSVTSLLAILKIIVKLIHIHKRNILLKDGFKMTSFNNFCLSSLICKLTLKRCEQAMKLWVWLTFVNVQFLYSSAFTHLVFQFLILNVDLQRTQWSALKRL